MKFQQITICSALSSNGCDLFCVVVAAVAAAASIDAAAATIDVVALFLTSDDLFYFISISFSLMSFLLRHTQQQLIYLVHRHTFEIWNENNMKYENNNNSNSKKSWKILY